MIDGLFNEPSYLAAKKMLDATVLRHEAIASNLANVETPHYRRLDVGPSFKAELSRALENKSPEQIASLKPQLMIDTAAVSHTKDGNTVQLEDELLQMNQNSLTHAVESQMVTNSLLRLRMAITGRPV
jgi:flagellar basal-body rod protein FlgB